MIRATLKGDGSPIQRQVMLHTALTFAWVALVVPSMLWWGESVKWVVLMSAWANIAGHWSAVQAAKGERENGAAMEALTEQVASLRASVMGEVAA